MEEWVTVVDFPDYEVSNRGRVRNGRRIIEPSSNNTGSIRINLRKGFTNYTRSVGRIVCRAFHGEPEEGEAVVYRDDDYTNCSADNVFWGDRGYAWERTHQRKRDKPMRDMRIEHVKSGVVYENSLECAKGIQGIEKYIVLCAGDPMNRFYKGSNYRWIV
jgi:hypothetical protein